MLNRVALLLAVAGLLLLPACGETAVETDPEEPDDVTEESAPGHGLTAVTTVYPLAALAEQIAPGAEVRLLTSSGQDPHDLELSPGDRRLVESADVVLYVGEVDFQPQVEAAVAHATGQVVSVAEVVGAGNLLPLEDHDHAHAHDHDDDDHDHAHAHDDDHEDDHAHDDDHAHGEAGVDPHVWFDAAAMSEVAEAIGEAFAAADDGDAEAYRDSAQEVHDDLLGLDEEIDALLSDCAHDTAIVSHEAYAYLLAPRGLQQEGISGAGGHGDASPQRLAELTERIRTEDIPAVLAEPVEGRADAEALANEAGVELLEIDPLEIGHDDLAGVPLADALREQAQTFATALECA